MKFFYADSLDLVDPKFDFETEKFAPGRKPQRDDVYAHELMTTDPPYDGLLVSMSLLHDMAGKGGKGRYTIAQRQRFEREKVHKFLRFPKEGTFDPEKYPIIGDCGAFSYRAEEVPPYSVEDVVGFYERSGFTHGISVDHMILAYVSEYDSRTRGYPDLMPPKITEEQKRRFDLTIELARAFFEAAKGKPFKPIGAAQGWSPQTYRRSVEQLLDIGYDYIALGGLVPLKTHEILAILDAVGEVIVSRGARLHLLGISRLDNFERYRRAGVVSLDSTSPLRQAFKDEKDNYYAEGGHYMAVRVPQSDGPTMLKLIKASKVEQGEVQRLERETMAAIRDFARSSGPRPVEELLAVLKRYNALTGKRFPEAQTRRTLLDRPWEMCPCPICKAVGMDVILFRGSNRNRRRGFHNLWWTHAQLRRYRDPGASGSPE